MLGDLALEAGREDLASIFATIGESALALKEPLRIKDGLAWHHNKTTDWEDTPQAIAFKPKIDKVRTAIKKAEAAAKTATEKEKVRKAWWHLVQGENSDGIWPKPPHKPADFNVKFCDDHLNAALALAQAVAGGTR